MGKKRKATVATSTSNSSLSSTPVVLSKQELKSTRNTVALNPLLKKSSVHEKSNKARRQSEKVTLKKTWFERVAA